MITLEQVEKLRERANISYEDAKSALEFSDGDLLEAVIYLEQQGKIRSPEMSSYNTQTGGVNSKNGYLTVEGQNHSDDERSYYEKNHFHKKNESRFREHLHYVWGKFREFIKKTNVNHFEVSKDGRYVVSMPITLLIISAVLFFWVTLPALIIALFLGFRYRIKGPDFGKDSINNAMDKAADTAENIKRAVMNENDDTTAGTRENQETQETQETQDE